MVSGSDQTHIDPAAYFTPEAADERPVSFLNKLYRPAFTGTAMFVAIRATKFFNGRPGFAGIQEYFIMIPVAIAVSLMINDFVLKRARQRDVVYYNYIKDHPEDFPLIERVKYRDVLAPYYPQRLNERRPILGIVTTTFETQQTIDRKAEAW